MSRRKPPTSEQQPTVYVIAGPNGAGKTTFATTFLPDFVNCREFLNADLIAAGLSPFAPETQNIRAGRLLLTRMRELTEAGANFGLETTLAGRSYLRQFTDWRKRGYRIVLFFLWLPNVELAIERVATRVQQGGHHVNDADIRRRFTAGLRNFWRVYQPLIDVWWLYEGANTPPLPIAVNEGGQLKLVDVMRLESFTQCVEGE
jgi:predicted ABC-type ATPase